MALKVGDLIPIGQGGYSLLSNVTDFKVDGVADGTIRLNWKDPEDVIVDGIKITSWEGTQIRRKQGNYPVNEKDGELVVDNKVRNQYANTPFEDTGLTNGVEYFYMAFPYTDKNVITVDSANRISATPQAYDDSTGSPGPKNLIGGTMDAGFFGEVPVSELMNGADLCSAIGLTQGNLQHSNEPFLKFAYNGKILFVNKKPIRNSVSWDAIASAGAVYGDGSSQGNAQVTIDGLTYKVRLMKGAREDPANWGLNDKSAIGSEWNDLMYPIHVNANTGDWNHSQYVGNDVPDWGINYTDEDLLTHYNFGDGSYSWTQETRSDDTSYRVNRGNLGVSRLGSGASSFTDRGRGARFVLELL